jgi:hypothetical protein
MARFVLRLLGLCVLAAAIVVPGCQALFPRDGSEGARPGVVDVPRNGQGS